MTGAELLALARHQLKCHSDYRLAMAFAGALRLLLPRLAGIQCSEVAGVLQQLVAEDAIRRNVRNDYSNAQARTNP